MHRPRPTAQTLNTVLQARGKRIATLAAPIGDWLEPRAGRLGYAVNQLMLVFTDGTALLFWSEMVRYGSHPWNESFVLSAEWLPIASTPLSYSNRGAPHGFATAVALNQALSGREIGELELFIDLSETYSAERDDDYPSDAMRMVVGSDTLELLTEGPGVLPLSVVVRGSAFAAQGALTDVTSPKPLQPGASDA